MWESQSRGRPQPTPAGVVVNNNNNNTTVVTHRAVTSGARTTFMPSARSLAPGPAGDPFLSMVLAKAAAVPLFIESYENSFHTVETPQHIRASVRSDANAGADQAMSMAQRVLMTPVRPSLLLAPPSSHDAGGEPPLRPMRAPVRNLPDRMYV